MYYSTQNYCINHMIWKRKINPEGMTGEQCKHFRKLLDRNQLGDSCLTSPGETNRCLLRQTKVRGLSISTLVIGYTYGIYRNMNEELLAELGSPQKQLSPHKVPSYCAQRPHGSCILEIFPVKLHFLCSPVSPTIL